MAFENFFEFHYFAFRYEAHKRLFSRVRIRAVATETGRGMYQILRYILFDGAYVVGDNEKFISRFAAFDDFVADNVGDKLA